MMVFSPEGLVVAEVLYIYDMNCVVYKTLFLLPRDIAQGLSVISDNCLVLLWEKSEIPLMLNFVNTACTRSLSCRL